MSDAVLWSWWMLGAAGSKIIMMAALTSSLPTGQLENVCKRSGSGLVMHRTEQQRSPVMDWRNKVLPCTKRRG
eukprot:12723609-Ditylum_brightwellii.AAC.1